jgi:hypothetical protein
MKESRADQLSRQYFGRPVGDVGQPISVPISDTLYRPLPQAALPHYWHPQREGVERPPDDFAEKLARIHVDLRVVRPPARAPVPVRCWLVWFPKPEITYNLCPGWHLKLAWVYGTRPLPLDERLLAAIYHFDARRYSSAVEYFDRVIEERERTKAIERKDYDNNRRAEQREWRESTKIKNIGRGSKFALHHDGTIIPSRAEVGWNEERLRTTLPSKVLREQKDLRERSL